MNEFVIVIKTKPTAVGSIPYDSILSLFGPFVRFGSSATLLLETSGGMPPREYRNNTENQKNILTVAVRFAFLATVDGENGLGLDCLAMHFLIL